MKVTEKKVPVSAANPSAANNSASPKPIPEVMTTSALMKIMKKRNAFGDNFLFMRNGK